MQQASSSQRAAAAHLDGAAAVRLGTNATRQWKCSGAGTQPGSAAAHLDGAEAVHLGTHTVQPRLRTLHKNGTSKPGVRDVHEPSLQASP